MVTGVVDRSRGIDAERLHWSFDVGGRSRILDLLPAALGGSVALVLDRRPLGRMPKPKPQRPWQEATFDVDGRSVVVALIWHRPVMRTDVFVDGRSLRGDRTIEDARRDAPEPLSNYETWIGGVFGGEVPQHRPLLPRRLGLAALVAIVVPIAALAVLPRPMIEAAAVAWGAMASLAYLALLLIWLRSWSVVMERAHSYLLTRPVLGDRRVFWFFAAFVGYGVASLAAMLAVLAVAVLASG